MKKIDYLSIGIILFSFVLAIEFYPSMPEKMATHWNEAGSSDGYMSKFYALFLMPSLSFLIYILFLLFPKIDPMKTNIEKFRKYYDGFIVIMLSFLLYIYILSLIWNLGFRFNMTLAVFPSLGFLFYYVGILSENAKRNWFMGVRTPWTLSSDNVWEKTNKLAGKLFKIGAIFAFLGIFLPDYALLLILVPIVFMSIYVTIYSYLEYQKEKR